MQCFRYKPNLIFALDFTLQIQSAIRTWNNAICGIINICFERGGKILMRRALSDRFPEKIPLLVGKQKTHSTCRNLKGMTLYGERTKRVYVKDDDI